MSCFVGVLTKSSNWGGAVSLQIHTTWIVFIFEDEGIQNDFYQRISIGLFLFTTFLVVNKNFGITSEKIQRDPIYPRLSPKRIKKAMSLRITSRSFPWIGSRPLLLKHWNSLRRTLENPEIVEGNMNSALTLRCKAPCDMAPETVIPPFDEPKGHFFQGDEKSAMP